MKKEKLLLVLIFCTTVIFIGAPAIRSGEAVSVWHSTPPFTSAGIWTVPENVTTVDILLVGGGGAGGAGLYGGGGGGGGVTWLTNVPVPATEVSFTVTIRSRRHRHFG